MENNTQGYVPYVPAPAAPRIKTLDYNAMGYGHGICHCGIRNCIQR